MKKIIAFLIFSFLSFSSLASSSSEEYSFDKCMEKNCAQIQEKYKNCAPDEDCQNILHHFDQCELDCKVDVCVRTECKDFMEENGHCESKECGDCRSKCYSNIGN